MVLIIAYLVQNIMVTFAIERFMRVFFEKVRTRLIIIFLSYLFYSIVTSFAFLFLNIPVINMLVSLITIFIITLNYTSSLIKRIVTMISIFLFLNIIEILVTSTYAPDDLSLFTSTEFSYFVVHFAIGLLTYLLSWSFQKLKNIRKNYVATSMPWTSMIFIPSLSFPIILVILLSPYSPQSVSIFIIVMLFGINLCAVYFHDIISKTLDDRYKALLEAKGKEYYISQCEIMQESVDKLKSFRHDTKMHLATLKEFAVKKNAEEVVGYIGLLIGDIEKSEIYSDTGNLAFDSIINYKLRNASNDHIKVNLEVFVPPILSFEIIDIVTILGNILDNALDAIEKIEEKWINLNIQHDKGVLLIKSENPFDGMIKFKDGNMSEIISTKQGDDHGYGLKNIRSSVKRYNGDFDISIKDDVFSISIIIFQADNSN